jgi:hypothetical protein
MSARNFPGGQGRPARKADNLTAICEPIILKMWEPRRLTTLLVSMAYYRDNFTYLPSDESNTQTRTDSVLLAQCAGFRSTHS